MLEQLEYEDMGWDGIYFGYYFVSPHCPTRPYDGNPQFQYQKENRQAANHSLSLTNRISWNSLGGGNLFVDIESRDWDLWRDRSELIEAFGEIFQ